MPPFRTALDQLALLAVPGIAQNYSLAAVPDRLNRAQLPALLVLPGDPQEDRFFRERGEGFHAAAFSNGSRTVSLTVTHLLLVAPVETGLGARSHLPTIVDHIDAYLDALADDVTLAGALAEPTRVRIEPGIVTHGDTRYHGCIFRHFWLLDL